MKKREMGGTEITRGSKNVYADLGLPDADKLKIKTDLVIQIIKAIERLQLTQAEAAQRMGISQPKVSAMINGDFSNLSERKLMDCLTCLGYNIEIRVKLVRKPIGSLRVAIA
jgi:predicted XRE-type DNA-binding protein